MFQFHWNHHQALLQKCIDPLHALWDPRRLHTIYVCNTRVFLFLLLYLDICFRTLKTLKTSHANVSCVCKMSYLLTQLKLFSNVASGLWWYHHVTVMSLTGCFPVLGGWVALLILMLDDII